MKKLIVTVFSALLIFGFVNGPVQVGAASKAPELVEPAAVATKYVSVQKYFSSSSAAPSSISYNSGGYSGTLYLSGSPQYDGTRWIAIYSGTVYACTSSGACIGN